MADVGTLPSSVHLLPRRVALDTSSVLISQVSTRYPSNFSSSDKFFPIRAFIRPSSSSPRHIRWVPKLRPDSFWDRAKSVLNKTCVSVIASALLLQRGPIKPALAACGIIEHSKPTSEMMERAVEESLASREDNLMALKLLLRLKMNLRKCDEADSLVDRLIVLEPGEMRWPLMKAQRFMDRKMYESAEPLFKEVIERDPFRVDAYYGLALVYRHLQSDSELAELVEKIERAEEGCRKKKKLIRTGRDFKLLIAQLRGVSKKYTAAQKLYGELVNDEPTDFRPYLCLGILYGALNDKENADKQFDKFSRLVPSDHPCRALIDASPDYTGTVPMINLFSSDISFNMFF